MVKLKLKSINDIRRKLGMGDIRYNNPKEAPKTSTELVEETILKTEIYRKARIAVLQHVMFGRKSQSVVLQAQSKQVAYGLDKYPEPLNPNTWSISETVEHIMDESIDKLHYLVMLRIKLEQKLVENWSKYNKMVTVQIEAVNEMINSAIAELDYLIILADEGPIRDDNMDAMAYSLKYMQKNLPDHGCCNLGDIKLSMSGADLDGDEALVEYAKADVEATHAFYTSSDQDDLNKGE